MRQRKRLHALCFALSSRAVWCSSAGMSSGCWKLYAQKLACVAQRVSSCGETQESVFAHARRRAASTGTHVRTSKTMLERLSALLLGSEK